MTTDEKIRDERIAALRIMHMTAVQQAMNEVVNEHRKEIVKRARAKLVALGVDPKDIRDGTIKPTTAQEI